MHGEHRHESRALGPNRRSWWQIPFVHGEDQKVRPVTQLDLYFDLIFAVLVSRLLVPLQTDITWHKVLVMACLFVPAGWIWIGYNYYQECYETDGVENRVFAFILCLVLLAFYVYAPTNLAVQSGGPSPIHSYLWVYCVGVLILIGMRLRAMVYVTGRHRQLDGLSSANLGVGVLLVFASLQTSGFLFHALLAVGFLIGLLTPMTVSFFLSQKLQGLNSSRYRERYSLWFLVMLGSSLSVSIGGLKGELGISALRNVIATLLLNFGLWWIYTDYINRRHVRKKHFSTTLYTYLHLPLALFIAGCGAACRNVIAGDSGISVYLIMLCVGGFLVVTGLLELTMHRSASEPSHPIYSPGIKFFSGGLAIFGVLPMISMVSAASSIWLGFVFLLPSIAYGLWAWFTQDLSPYQSAEATEPSAADVIAPMRPC